MTLSRPWKTGPAVCRIWNLYHAPLSLPVYLEPSIHLTRPTDTMSEQWGRNGAACLVCAQSASSSSHVGADVLEVRDQPVHQVARPGRVRDDRIGRAVMVECKRILTVTDVAGIDTAQAEDFQMPHQCAVASTRLGKAADATKVRNQRDHCCRWRRVEISLAALEVGPLAHQLAPVSSVGFSISPFERVALIRARYSASHSRCSRAGGPSLK